MSHHLFTSFKNFFEDFSPAKFTALEDIYTDDVHFIDPITDVQGIDALKKHFISTGQGLIQCHFNFISEVFMGNKATLEWEMVYAHPKLASGKLLHLSGCSVIAFNDEQRIHYHRDYYDMGEMVYEHIFLLGGGIQLIKKRLIS